MSIFHVLDLASNSLHQAFQSKKRLMTAATQTENLNESMLALLCLALCSTPALHAPSQQTLYQTQKKVEFKEGAQTSYF